MKFIRSIIIVFLLLCAFTNAHASDNSRFDWMNSTFETITSVISGCIYPPQFSGLHQSTASLNLEDSGAWIPTGAYVDDGKLLQIEWSSKGVQPRPAKYRVLYRIDPRFEQPQVFIQKYDYVTNKYISDFYHFKDGLLLQYQGTAEMTFSSRIKDYTDYFAFNGRPKISVKKDDVVNITIDSDNSYFGSNSEMNSDIGSLDDLLVVYSQSSILDNRIIYTNAEQFCLDGIKPSSPGYGSSCHTTGIYLDVLSNWNTFEGRINSSGFDINKGSINSCNDTASGLDNIPLCYYDKGRGMEFKIGGTTIKAITEKFVNSPFTGKDFFYHKSNIDGDLSFETSWQIAGMYNGYSQFMKDWGESSGYSDFQSRFNSMKTDLTMNFLHFGRYLMDIEIGNSVTAVSTEDLDAIKVEYIIAENGMPDNSSSGTAVDRYYRSNAEDSGYLFVRVVRQNENLTGTIQVKIANYTGVTWFSDLVYGKLVKPLRDKFNELSEIIYNKLVSNAALQNIGRSLLVIYVIMYGLMFLAGATQITVTDIVTRVLKIGVVLSLFSETSWTFFNNYLFKVFVDGTDSLLSSVTGVTSTVGNVFGFIDPIIDRYTNPTIWALLLIQLLQIHTGLTFFAIITMYSIMLYFRAILEVIVSYCLAFLGLAIMISLAPFFIMFILFERTRSMFDNWLSIMFSYMIQPTILLIFFLLIDQIMADHITRTIVAACWDTLIPLKISLDLNNMGIPLSFSFSIPFLPGIPFYVPEVSPIENINDFFSKSGTIAMIATSSLLFFALSKLAKGLVDYMTLVVQYLTNVLAARQDGKLQKGLNPISDIVNDMGKVTKPFKGGISKVKSFAKEKLIDQKISHRTQPKTDNLDYSKFGANKEEYKSTDDSKNSWVSGVVDKDKASGTGIKIGEARTKKTDSGWLSASQSSKPGATAPKVTIGQARAKTQTPLSPDSSTRTPWQSAKPSGESRQNIKNSDGDQTTQDSSNTSTRTPWQSAKPSGESRQNIENSDGDQTTQDSSNTQTSSPDSSTRTPWQSAKPSGKSRQNIENSDGDQTTQGKQDSTQDGNSVDKEPAKVDSNNKDENKKS